MTRHTKKLNLVKLMSTVDRFLAEAEGALNGYTQFDLSDIYRVFHRHQITVFEAGVGEPHTCEHTQDNTVVLGFVMYDTERIAAKFYSDNIVEVQKEFTLRPRTALHAVHSAVWTKQIDCGGHAARDGNLFHTLGLKGTMGPKSQVELPTRDLTRSAGVRKAHK